MKIMLFNGPPGCGKDEAAACLSPEFTPLKFAGFLKDTVHDMYGVPVDKAEEDKDKPGEYMPNGKTLREAYIQMSEHFFKPMYGNDFFGRVVAVEIADSDNDCFAISDSGFVEEAQVLVNRFGAESVTLVKIKREGCSFKGDSRSYIELEGVKTVTVNNDGTLEDFHNKIKELANG